MEKKFKENWPNFFVVGAARAGTDSLYNYLKNISEIYLPDEKSAGYFSSINPEKYMNEKRYLKLYESVKNEKVIGEVNPDYLIDPKVSKLIHEKIPHAKIIISLRNPILSTFSLYMHREKHNQVSSQFHSSLINYKNSSESIKLKQEIHDVILTGFYSKMVERYYNEFGKENVKIIIFEEFIKNTEKSIREILKFLKINENIQLPSNLKIVYNQNEKPIGTLGNKIINSSIKKTSKKIFPGKIGIKLLRSILNKKGKPELSTEEYDILKSIYSMDVQKLEVILNRKLPW